MSRGSAITRATEIVEKAAAAHRQAWIAGELSAGRPRAEIIDQLRREYDATLQVRCDAARKLAAVIQRLDRRALTALLVAEAERLYFAAKLIGQTPDLRECTRVAFKAEPAAELLPDHARDQTVFAVRRALAALHARTTPDARC